MSKVSLSINWVINFSIFSKYIPMETMYPFYIGVVKLDSKIGNMFTMDLTKSDPHSLLAEVDFSLKVF